MTVRNLSPMHVSLERSIVAQAVKQLEDSGPLDDGAQLRQAFQTRSTRAEQALERSWLLGQRLGLPQELSRWRKLAKWCVLVLAALMALAALATTQALLTPGIGINVMAALVTLLGWNTVMLVLWLIALPLKQRSSEGTPLGRVALEMAARIPFERGPHAILLVRACTAVLQQARLWPWLTGLLSHTIWTLHFVLMIVLLIFGFAFHAYQLTWESTILSPQSFERLIHFTGALPALLGFPVPDATAVLQAGHNAVALTDSDTRTYSSQWAWWLISCVVTYGLLPRALLVALSFWLWRTGQGRLSQSDMADPYLRRIIARLGELEPPPEVIDPEQRVDTNQASASATAVDPSSYALLGFELPPEIVWPPVQLPPPSAPALSVDGSASQCDAALMRLAQMRPAVLVLVCHASSSPDRGTARFIRQSMTLAGCCALSLVGMSSAATASRWRDWLISEKFDAITFIETQQNAADWIIKTRVALQEQVSHPHPRE